VSGSPRFRSDLYRGTASYYDRFRLRYPGPLVDDLCSRTSVDGTGRLLDLACGPGTVTFALSPRFREVYAVDLEPETVEFAAAKAADAGVTNVRWTAGRAEDIESGEPFDLVTIGTAFHRLDRARVAALAMEWLRAGGHLALLWSSTPVDDSAVGWQEALTEVVVEWTQRLDVEDRVPPELASHITKHPHVEVVANAGFDVVGHYEFEQPHDWTIEELVGFVYSTSLLPRAVLGDRAVEFEADVRTRLDAIEPSGVFREDATFAYDLAAKPGRSREG
jgi:ubiquinone/menaquinone biosynthesis C-methylase UbiE